MQFNPYFIDDDLEKKKIYDSYMREILDQRDKIKNAPWKREAVVAAVLDFVKDFDKYDLARVGRLLALGIPEDKQSSERPDPQMSKKDMIRKITKSFEA